jgi:hypothetical protein
MPKNCYVIKNNKSDRVVKLITRWLKDVCWEYSPNKVVVRRMRNALIIYTDDE